MIFGLLTQGYAALHPGLSTCRRYATRKTTRARSRCWVRFLICFLYSLDISRPFRPEISWPFLQKLLDTTREIIS